MFIVGKSFFSEILSKFHIKTIAPLSVKSETRLSTDSRDSLKKKCRKMRQDEMDPNDHDPNQEGQPPKKRGKGKGKAAATNNNKDPNGPKRVFVCPHCQVLLQLFCVTLINFHPSFHFSVPMTGTTI